MKVYEPLDVLEPVGPDLWIADGSIVRLALGPLSMPFPTRMVVARLAAGDLLVWSPTELSPALRERVNSLGPVRHLVSPNRLHYAHVAAWKKAYPAAIAWASPGVRERARSRHLDVSFDRDLGEVPDPEWAREIDQLVFRGSSALEEVVFFHLATRTLVLADLIQNFEPERLTFSERMLARLGGVCDPDGKAPGDLRLTFLGRRDVARRSFARLVAWTPERVVIAHGRWYEHHGLAQLHRAFRWLG